MLRPVLSLVPVLPALLCGMTLAHAYDYRLDPGAANRTEMHFAFAQRAAAGSAPVMPEAPGLGSPTVPPEYASAMTWYRAALAEGHDQPPIVAYPGLYEGDLPAALEWTWSAENGDLLTRTGKGVYRMSVGSTTANWYREFNCRMVTWPSGSLEAKMQCDDGVERSMLIPGDGIVIVDDTQFARVFQTELPPEEPEIADPLPAVPFENAQ